MYEEEHIDTGYGEAVGGAQDRLGIGLGDPFKDDEPEPVRRKGAILKQEFVGCNDVEPEGVKDAGWYSNFFFGSIMV